MAPTLTRPPEDEEDQDQDNDGLEDLYHTPARRDQDRNTTPNPADIATREAQGYGPYDTSSATPQHKEQQALDNRIGGGYRHEGPGGGAKTAVGTDGEDKPEGKKGGRLNTLLTGIKGKFDDKTSKLSNKQKSMLFGIGLGGSGLALLLLAAIVLFATLKIPNLAEHIASYQFTRTTRAFRQSLRQINGEKIAVDSLDPAEQGKVRAHYEKFRSATWGKLDKWRPELTYKNMQATGSIDYRYSAPGPLGGQRLEAIRLNGVEIPVDSPSIKQRVINSVNPLTPKADLILAAQVDAGIAKALPEHNSLVRSSIAKKIYADLGIKLHWWDKQGKTFKGTTAVEADLLELRESVKRMESAIDDGSIVSMIEEATKDAEEAQKKCLQNDDCAKRLLESHPDNPKVAEEIQRAKATGDYRPTNFLAEEAVKAIDSGIDNATIYKVAEGFSTTSAILQGVCTIYDGSVDRSGGVVDGTGKSAMAAFMAIASAADQQKAGDTTAEAVGATVRKIGDPTDSIPYERADNQFKPVSTDSVASPQGSASGMFTLTRAIFGDAAADKLDPVIEPTCGVATTWQFGVAAGIAEVVVGVITGGTSKVASGAGQAAGKVTMGAIFASLRNSLLSKKALTKMLGQSATIAGLTIVAKMIVLSRMDVTHSGVARESDFANNGDQGGNLMAQQYNQKILGGAPMTQPEVVKSVEADRKYLAEMKGQEGVFERYLALSNPDSLLVNMGVAFSAKATNKKTIASLLAGTSTRFSSSMLNTGLAGTLNPFKSQLAMAQSNSIDTNYQIVQWGWTEDELALIENDPSYFPLENSVRLASSNRASEVESKYGECFTSTMGELLAKGKIQRDENGRVYEDHGLCSPKNLSRHNPEGFGDLVFRWRLSKRNDNTLDHLNDIAKPTNSNSASANSAAPGGGLGVSPEGFTFPLKTTKTHLTQRPREKWCHQQQTYCHHHYKAADIFADPGTPVVAAKSGTIIFGHNNPTGGTGSSVAIMGEDKNVYWYGHLKSGSVKFTTAGQRVEAGTEIGQVGEDADAQNTASHLHIDVQPPPATTREGCIDAACNQPPFNFLDIQPALVKAYEALPD